jgi:hypothetical protein
MRWRIDLPLHGHSVNKTVSEQRLGNNVPAATNMHANIEIFFFKRGVIYGGPCRDIITGAFGAMNSIVSSISQRTTA